MYKTKSINNIDITLHTCFLRIFLRVLLELTGFEDKILEAVKDPDIVLQGHKQEKLALKFYAKTPISPKTLVVVYREDKQIIITAFLTSKAGKIIRRRKTLWRKAS